ncbi:PEGA domain-containing protein [Methanoregula sp.]|uniref:PEGA domain-containing protein n=1 Tax=Methanoregula sp. TaxID=2052170 RepID=UPI002632141E|nr:PEGA domain-containing protein [Methanoregula sp.]MDD5141847.1 PEGA domain-containing protein [Methanoregula sp.]
MSRFLLLLILSLAWITLCVASSGCIAPAAPIIATETGQEGGTITIISHPPGAEISLDEVFRGLTPLTLEDIPAGKHVIRLTMAGYESWSVSLSTGNKQNETITAELIAGDSIVPVTTSAPSVSPHAAPKIHVDGYWEYPEGRVTTENPVPLVVHTEAFNTGTAAAREVTVSANFYYRGRMACWNALNLGTLAAGGHVSRKSLVSCTLPLPVSEEHFELKFENIVLKE